MLGKLGNGPLFVLADPDLLNNHGMADARRAAAALALLDWLNSTDAEAVHFDVTLNGLGNSKSPLKLAFDPPFLAVTLALVAALLLAAFLFGRSFLGRSFLRGGRLGRRGAADASSGTAGLAAEVEGRKLGLLALEHLRHDVECPRACSRLPPRARDVDLDGHRYLGGAARP